MAGETALNYTSNSGYLTINSVSMHCPAWTMGDIVELWTPAASARGENLVIPGAQGTIARRKRFHEARYSLPLAVAGSHDRLGSPYANPYIGLETNLKYLYDHIVTVGTVALTYAATLVMPSGTTRNAQVQVEGIYYDEHVKDLIVGATLELVIPSGGFA